MTISKSESVQSVRTFLSHTKKQISAIESIINSVKLNVIQRYSINITKLLGKESPLIHLCG